MKISIREYITNNGCIDLKIYRPRERTFCLSGGATQTKSGFWIVNIPGQPADVVKSRSEAITLLHDYYAAKQAA